MTRLAQFLVAATALSATSAVAEESGKAPWSQAEGLYNRAAFAESRSALIREHGGMTSWAVHGERFEYRTNEGAPLLFADIEGWWGGDRNKLWLKSEVEYDFDADHFEETELQALWSRAIGRYFDVQTGIRRDFSPDPSRTYGVLGIKGLAPYWFHIDAALFVSGHGDVTARLESEYELLLTQRLVLQPRAEMNFAMQSVPALEIGEGLSTVALGGRLRYEITRRFAPYVGVEWARSVGETADFARAAGEDPAHVSFIAGLRFSF